MKYLLTNNSRVDFTAHAPMHTFRGWANRGLTGNMDIDIEDLSLVSVDVVLDTDCLDTGDNEKNRAMQDFFELDRHLEAGFVMTECLEFCRKKKGSLAGNRAGHS